jgi:DNA-binding NarL/FixJ family response regulator
MTMAINTIANSTNSTSDTTQIAILEDEDMLRGLLTEWLASQPNTVVVDQFRSVQAFNHAITTSLPKANLLICDVQLPDGDGITAALSALSILDPKPGLIVISGRPTADLFARLSENVDGGWAFLLKNHNGLANFTQAISAVRSGLVMVDPNLKTIFSKSERSMTLTDQERTVMDKVARGMSNAVIAGEIFASEKTVERLLTSIYSKYDLVGTSKLENPRVRATLIYRGLLN